LADDGPIVTLTEEEDATTGETTDATLSYPFRSAYIDAALSCPLRIAYMDGELSCAWRMP
jgi:hypothetical protein